MVLLVALGERQRIDLVLVATLTTFDEPEQRFVTDRDAGIVEHAGVPFPYARWRW